MAMWVQVPPLSPNQTKLTQDNARSFQTVSSSASLLQGRRHSVQRRPHMDRRPWSDWLTQPPDPIHSQLRTLGTGEGQATTRWLMGFRWRERLRSQHHCRTCQALHGKNPRECQHHGCHARQTSRVRNAWRSGWNWGNTCLTWRVRGLAPVHPGFFNDLKRVWFNRSSTCPSSSGSCPIMDLACCS